MGFKCVKCGVGFCLTESKGQLEKLLEKQLPVYCIKPDCDGLVHKESIQEPFLKMTEETFLQLSRLKKYNATEKRILEELVGKEIIDIEIQQTTSENRVIIASLSTKNAKMHFGISGLGACIWRIDAL